MTYDFSFDKKSVWALLAGSLVLGVLLFVAGVLVGGNFGEKSAAEQAEADESKDDADGESAAARQKAREATAPAQPVLLREPLAPVADVPVAAGPGVVAPGASGTFGAAPGLAPQGTVAPGVVAPRAPSAASAAPPDAGFGEAAPRSYPPPRDPDPKLVQEAETGGEASADAADSPGPVKGLVYSVQVGDYQEEKGARRLAEELEQKGYTPSIFSGRDAENRLWFAVRIGAYAGAKDATQAAANFTKQEKLKASVRPVNSF